MKLRRKLTSVNDSCTFARLASLNQPLNFLAGDTKEKSLRIIKSTTFLKVKHGRNSGDTPAALRLDP